MKHLMHLLMPLLIMLQIGSCEKKSQSELDKLPPATQEGKIKIGCLVNGKAWVPNSVGLAGPDVQAWYQYNWLDYINKTERGYFLGIAGSMRTKEHLEGININSNNKAIAQGGVYILGNCKDDGGICGEFAIFKNGNINAYSTNQNHRGELRITRFDDHNQIISGLFWFDAVNANGEKVEVREGRFDIRFTK